MHTTVFIGTSLDGFIARADGGIDWLDAPQELEGEDYGYNAFIDTIDAIVMGRNTFETVLGFGWWPYAKRVIVLTSRPIDAPADIAERIDVMSGDPHLIVEQLSKQGIDRIYIDGGIVIQRFVAAGLVNRMIITRLPILIGSGVPLFGELPHDAMLTHVATRSYANGLVQSEYEIAREQVAR